MIFFVIHTFFKQLVSMCSCGCSLSLPLPPSSPKTIRTRQVERSRKWAGDVERRGEMIEAQLGHKGCTFDENENKISRIRTGNRSVTITDGRGLK